MTANLGHAQMPGTLTAPPRDAPRWCAAVPRAARLSAELKRSDHLGAARGSSCTTQPSNLMRTSPLSTGVLGTTRCSAGPGRSPRRPGRRRRRRSRKRRNAAARRPAAALRSPRGGRPICWPGWTVATRPSRPCDRRDYGTPCRICRCHERLGDLGLPYDLAIARFNLARADVQQVL
jgi:hypothetical protein